MKIKIDQINAKMYIIYTDNISVYANIHLLSKVKLTYVGITYAYSLSVLIYLVNLNYLNILMILFN